MVADRVSVEGTRRAASSGEDIRSPLAVAAIPAGPLAVGTPEASAVGTPEDSAEVDTHPRIASAAAVVVTPVAAVVGTRVEDITDRA
jgi:hypothetical protein